MCVHVYMHYYLFISLSTSETQSKVNFEGWFSFGMDSYEM